MAKVYVKTDEQGRIVAINSEIFLEEVSGWIEVDEGEGDRYAHAQGHYLDKGLIEMDGTYAYKLENGAVTERTEAEKEADRALIEEPMTLEQRVTEMEMVLVARVYGGGEQG